MVSQMVYGNDDDVYINHDGIVHETKKGLRDEGAVLFTIRGHQQWIPKKLMGAFDNKVVAVKKWWAEKNKLRSDW